MHDAVLMLEYLHHPKYFMKYTDLLNYSAEGVDTILSHSNTVESE